MTAKLHYTLLQPISATATTNAAGFSATNVLLFSVRRPWRSTSAAANNLDIDLGALYLAPIICIQGPNTSTCVLSYGSGGYTTINAGVQNLALDRHGRRKHSLALAGNVRFIRFAFGGAVPDDGAGYYEVGAVYPFASTLNLPENALLGSDATAQYPLQRTELPNGNRIVVERGPPRQQLSLRFRGSRTADMDQLSRRAKAAPCWLDLGVTANRELQWPVRHDEDTTQRNFAQALQDESTIVLGEVA